MKPTRTVPTLDDVAKAANVSTATVSRCLNTPERVVEATRARVMKAVDELGYTPNFGARVMAANRTYTIGAIIPTMENAIFARGIQAFQEELHARGYTLLVSSSLYRPEVEEEQIRALVARGADGLLLIGRARDPALYDYLARQDVPVLTAWAYVKDAVPPSIGFNNHAAMRAVAQAVLDLGHRNIGVISAHTKGNDRAAERVNGIWAAHRAAGLSADSLQIVETAYGIDEGAMAFEYLLRRDVKPTAVICGNDVLAAGALRQARVMGLDVPGDVSLTGFDNMDLSRIVIPPLSTVDVPHREMGRQAAVALVEMVEMVETQESHPSVELDISLILRGSLSAPSR